MSYIKRDDIPVRDGEMAVELDSGDCVAVSCNREVKGSRIYFSGEARAVKENGDQRYRDGRTTPLKTNLAHNDPRATIADLIAVECIMALLGEPTSHVQWSEEYLLNVSIRHAIDLSTIPSGAFDAASAL